MEKARPLSPLYEALRSPDTTGTLSNESLNQPSRNGKLPTPRLRDPWRHSVSRNEPTPASRTVREFKPRRQRQRLFVKGVLQWLVTALLCALLAVILKVFSSLLWMSVGQVKAFNAIIVLLSLFLGNNLTSSLREYAMMLRWRLLAAKYRPLNEFDLIMHCESLRKVMKLFWVARNPGRFWLWLNKTQLLCVIWLCINLVLQVLVALLGLTYNLDTSTVPGQKFGEMSIANLSVIRDVWGADNPTFSAQLGSANSYGIQGQDYLFVNTTPPGQGSVPSYGTPGSPTIYANDDWTVMSYIFQDLNPLAPDIALLSHRKIETKATCQSFRIIEGGNGSSPVVTFLDSANNSQTLDVVRVGPGATTYVGVLNSTCGSRCTEIFALQSSDNDLILQPQFWKCSNTISTVDGLDEYVSAAAPEGVFQLPDLQARILAGAIGWTGFNFSTDDMYQYVRYTTDTWWSPNTPADEGVISRRIMEFSIEAIAAIDYNGPRFNVTGWYPVPAQVVLVQWRWAASTLGAVALIQLLALLCVIAWANSAIIRDASCLSTARLMRPVVEKLGNRGCLLTGPEIAEELAHMKVKYGFRESRGFVWRNQIPTDAGSGDDGVRHVDVLDEGEGYGIQGTMPAGRYDGWEEEQWDERTALLRRRERRSMSI